MKEARVVDGESSRLMLDGMISDDDIKREGRGE